MDMIESSMYQKATFKNCDMLEDVTRPLTTSMKFFGLWHDPISFQRQVQPVDSDIANQTKPRKSSSLNRYALNRFVLVYQIFITSVMWFEFFRFLTAVITKLGLNFDSAIFLIWFLKAALTNSVVLLAIVRTCKMLRFISLWQTGAGLIKEIYVDDSSVSSVPREPHPLNNYKRFIRAGRVVACCGWLFVILFTGLSAYLSFSETIISRMLCEPWTDVALASSSMSTARSPWHPTSSPSCTSAFFATSFPRHSEPWRMTLRNNVPWAPMPEQTSWNPLVDNTTSSAFLRPSSITFSRRWLV